MIDTDYTTGLRERLDPPGIIDVHTHFMPHRVMREVWAYFDAAGPMTGREWPITELLRRHPRLRPIVAHMGTPEYSEFLGLGD